MRLKPKSVGLIAFAYLVWLAIDIAVLLGLKSSHQTLLKELWPGAWAGGGLVLMCWAISSIIRADRKR